MKHILKALLLGSAAAVVVSSSAFANPQDPLLYSNGPANGSVDAWTINEGFAVGDTFTLSTSAKPTGADFTTWNFPGDTISTVNWSVDASNPDGTINFGDVLGSGTANVTSTDLGTNADGYDMNLNDIGGTGTNPVIVLAAGTYWFILQDAVVTNGDPVYWDMNGGPSQVWESANGYNPAGFSPGLANASTAFNIYGTTGVPAPGALALLGFGLVGLGRMRRKVKAI